MVERCPRCNLKFEQIDGHLTGALGINTIACVIMVFLVGIAGFLLTFPELPLVPLVTTITLVAAIFPIVFYPYSKTIWTPIDLRMRPPAPRRGRRGIRRLDAAVVALLAPTFSLGKASTRRDDTPMSRNQPELLDWLSSPDNPPVRYLTARDLIDPRPSDAELQELHSDLVAWEPLHIVLERQLPDGSFPSGQKTPTAQPTFSALALMQRCGLDVTDEPVDRALRYLAEYHMSKGAFSYTSGGSGVLPCYAGVLTAALIKMGAADTDVVKQSVQWLVDHQRFDHKATKAGGQEKWPYRAPQNYGCWDSVSCYHGVAGAFRAFAALPEASRSSAVRERLAEAIEYLRIHHLYRKTANAAPLFRFMTRFFLVGDYRSNLLDMLEGIADTDPGLVGQPWVESAIADVEVLAPDGRVTLANNYGRKLIQPIPIEVVGEPSRFLTYQWLNVLKGFRLDYAA